MTTETETPAPAADTDTPPASPPATQIDMVELSSVKEELAALRAEIAELAKAKPAAPIVPSTETPPPAITPKAPDLSGLPVHARMAAGYSK
jgi:hypothetical protein